MSTAGARHCADVAGAYYIDPERGGGPVVSTTTSQQAAASAPLAYRADMDAETIAILAGIVGVSVAEFDQRYKPKQDGAGAAGAR